MTESFIYCFATAPFTAGGSVVLTDISTLTDEIIPANTFVDSIYFTQSSFTTTTLGITTPSISTFSIGWAGNTNAIVPTTGLVTATQLDANSIRYAPSGAVNGNNASETLMLTSSGTITSGTVNLVLKIISY
jgi:hypothetical protein